MTTTLRTPDYAIRDTCSHGIGWHAECAECDLISARELVQHWGESIDAARELIAKASAPPPSPPIANVIVRIGGKPFRCECGCNVFHHPEGKLDVFACNACDLQYEGE